LCAAFLPVVASATTIVPHTLAQRAQASDRVALVQVLSRIVVGDPQHLKTLVEVAVGDDIRGTGASHLTIVQIGGSKDGYEMHIPGDAVFDVGEVSLVFLRCDQARCALVAMGEGKVQVNGETAIVHDLKTNEFVRTPLASVIAELRQVPSVPGTPGPGGGVIVKTRSTP